MGLIQFLFDAWIGSTTFAFARRAGVLLPPKLENVAGDGTRNLVRKYLQLGESTADQLEAAQRALTRGSSASRGQASADATAAARRLSAEATKWMQRGNVEGTKWVRRGRREAERVIRNLRNRSR